MWFAPTGSTKHGLGSGTTSFESFAAFDQLFRSNAFIQTQLGGEIPVDTAKAPQAMFWNTAVGQMFARKNGFGRLWSPMCELLMSRDFETGAKTNWDVVPQMQVSLSTRQHVLASAGVRVPVNDTKGRSPQLMFYLIWDWYDAPLFSAW